MVKSENKRSKSPIDDLLNCKFLDADRFNARMYYLDNFANRLDITFCGQDKEDLDFVGKEDENKIFFAEYIQNMDKKVRNLWNDYKVRYFLNKILIITDQKERWSLFDQNPDCKICKIIDIKNTSNKFLYDFILFDVKIETKNFFKLKKIRNLLNGYFFVVTQNNSELWHILLDKKIKIDEIYNFGKAKYLLLEDIKKSYKNIDGNPFTKCLEYYPKEKDDEKQIQYNPLDKEHPLSYYCWLKVQGGKSKQSFDSLFDFISFCLDFSFKDFYKDLSNPLKYNYKNLKKYERQFDYSKKIIDYLSEYEFKVISNQSYGINSFKCPEFKDNLDEILKDENILKKKVAIFTSKKETEIVKDKVKNQNCVFVYSDEELKNDFLPKNYEYIVHYDFPKKFEDFVQRQKFALNSKVFFLRECKEEYFDKYVLLCKKYFNIAPFLGVFKDEISKKWKNVASKKEIDFSDEFKDNLEYINMIVKSEVKR